MTISGKAVRPRTLDVIPSVPRLAGLRPPPVHILVIEDHDDTRDVLDMLLRTEGYEVTLAVTAWTAREVPPAAGRHRARGHLHAAQERYRHHPGADARLPRLRLHRDVGGR